LRQEGDRAGLLSFLFRDDGAGDRCVLFRTELTGHSYVHALVAVVTLTVNTKMDS